MKSSLPPENPKQCPCGHKHLSWSPGKDEVQCWDCNRKHSVSECFGSEVVAPATDPGGDTTGQLPSSVVFDTRSLTCEGTMKKVRTLASLAAILVCIIFVHYISARELNERLVRWQSDYILIRVTGGLNWDTGGFFARDKGQQQRF